MSLFCRKFWLLECCLVVSLVEIKGCWDGCPVGWKERSNNGCDVGYCRDNWWEDGCADGWYEGRNTGWMYGWAVERLDGWVDGSSESCIVGWADGCEEGWFIDGCIIGCSIVYMVL